MKFVYILIIICLSYCFYCIYIQKDEKEKECRKQGLVLKKHVKTLNFRSGEYEYKDICVKKK